MTTEPRILFTPRVESQAFASGTTARAHHGYVLAELVNDATGGHPGQRFGIGQRTAGGTYHWFYRRTTVARHLVVRAVVATNGGTYTAGHGAVLTLTVTDGTNTVSTTPTIPPGLDGGDTWQPINTTALRTETFAHYEWTMSLDALAATLTASDNWRVKLVATVGATAFLESFQAEELPRWLVDTADSYGQIPTDYLPRGVIRDGATGLQRIWATARVGYTDALRTYHAQVRPEADPWSSTSTAAYEPLGGDIESGTTPITYVCRPRRMRGTTRCKVRWRLRYRTVGMSSVSHTASVQLLTGHASSPFAVTLADTAGTWTDTAAQTAYLITDGTDRLDTISFLAKTQSGTLEVSSRWVADDPD
jgi:hypothetical protein